MLSVKPNTLMPFEPLEGFKWETSGQDVFSFIDRTLTAIEKKRKVLATEINW